MNTYANQMTDFGILHHEEQIASLKEAIEKINEWMPVWIGFLKEFPGNEEIQTFYSDIIKADNERLEFFNNSIQEHQKEIEKRKAKYA